MLHFTCFNGLVVQEHFAVNNKNVMNVVDDHYRYYYGYFDDVCVVDVVDAVSGDDVFDEHDDCVDFDVFV